LLSFSNLSAEASKEREAEPNRRHIETFDRKKDADARHAEIRVDVRFMKQPLPGACIILADLILMRAFYPRSLLEPGLPGIVRHAVDDLFRLFFTDRHAPGSGSLLVPI
jgi:hypothetical protein